MDMGCSYAGFASDLTRTVPANGSFSGLRGEVYKLLLDAQLAGIEAAVEGAAFDEPHKVCREILIDGLEEMGLLMQTWAGVVEDGVDWREKALDRVFPHSTSHFIGRVVHDIGSRKVAGRDGLVELRAGMRLTIEPGLYFYPDLPGLPEELSGFGARIEDVCLVSAGGQPPEVLTALCPKDPETIEAFARTCGLLSASNTETNAN
jgi:Xaa-Pro aminopeptidase